MLHDLARDGELIVDNEKLKNILCLSQWHKEHIYNAFPEFSNKITIMLFN